MTRRLLALILLITLLCVGFMLVAQLLGQLLPPEDEIIYSANLNKSNYQIYRRVLDRNISMSLTRNHADSTSPDWSPDGKQIVFVGNQSRAGTIYIMDADGHNLHVMSEPINGNQDNPKWSPDGQSIAYVFLQNADHVMYEPQLMVFNLQTQTARYMTNYYNSSLLPYWSPDSSQIAFVTDMQAPSTYHLVSVNLKSGNIESLTSAQRNEYNPAWSPDGRYIAHEGNNANGIYLLDMSDKQSDLLYPMTQGSYVDGWSPDSRYLLFTEQESDFTRHLFKLDIQNCLQEQASCAPSPLFPEPQPGIYNASRWRPRQP